MTTNSHTASLTASAICDCLDITLRYADLLAADIPTDSFGHMPHPNMNHPAFCFGHLAMYPNMVLDMIGRADLKVEKPGWGELFNAPIQCVEQDGRYPGKDEIMAHFMERHRAVSAALREVSSETLEQEHDGYFKGKIKTVGGVVNFMLAGHTMLHMGQVSAWRRAMGLPPAM